MPDLAAICSYLLLTPELQNHAAAIGQDPTLSASLVRLLAPTFQAASIVVQLPLERRSARYADWGWADMGSLATVLAAEQLRAGLAAHLAADGAGVGNHTLQLLLPACQLVSLPWPLGMEAGLPAQQASL